MEDQQQRPMEGSHPSFVVQDGIIQLGGQRQVDEPGKAGCVIEYRHQRSDLESGHGDPGMDGFHLLEPIRSLLMRP